MEKSGEHISSTRSRTKGFAYLKAELQIGPTSYFKNKKSSYHVCPSLWKKGKVVLGNSPISVIWFIFFSPPRLLFFFLEGIIKIKSKTNIILQRAGLAALCDT